MNKLQCVAVIVALCCTLLVTVDAVQSYRPTAAHRDQRLIMRQNRRALSPTPSLPPAFSYNEFELHGQSPFGGPDTFSQVSKAFPQTEVKEMSATDNTVLLEVQAQTQAQVQKVRSYCEICILVMQMKQRGEPHLCAGLNANYYITCIEILESLLRADKAVVYWLKNGCMHMDSTGPEIVRPCPALSICSWVPNLFAQPPSLVRDGVESLCPKDPKFLPTIPNEYRALLGSESSQSQTQSQG